MKCKHCDGAGFFENGASQFKCVYCNGTGEVMTNEEWLNSLNTEEKARFLHDIQFSCNTCTLTSFRHYKSNIMQCPLNVACAKENGIIEWLQQPYKGGRS